MIQSVSKKDKFRRELLAELDLEDKKIPSNPDEQASDLSRRFGEFFKSKMTERKLKAGDIVKGRIIGSEGDYVVVDVNYKSEGLIPKSEFQSAGGIKGAEVGSEVDVYIDSVENEKGMMVLSKDRADIMRVWEDISSTAKSGKIIEGTVIAKVKGGLHVDIGGVKAFLPGSQIELRPVKQLDPYVSKTYSFKIIKFNQKRGNIVLSRRVILQEERDQLRSQTLGGIEKGAVVKGIVKNITDYGAFLDLGGIDGLLHIADISWNRIQHPSEKLSVGDQMEVKVLKFDKDKNRVSLGLKQLNENDNPWEQVRRELKVGSEVQGKVTSLTDYGAFVSIKEGVEGLVHISELSWGRKVKDPSEVLSIGQEITLQIVGIDHDHQRISFSKKRLEPSPWTEWTQKYPEGAKVNVKVLSTAEAGLVVEFGEEEKMEGLIRYGDLSWSGRSSSSKPKYNAGDSLDAVILQFNEEDERFHLGVKQLSKNPWEEIESLYPIGSIHEVKVVKIVDFGAFVELDRNGVEGLIHISELAQRRVEKVEDAVRVGDVISAEIITMDKDSQKIGLSCKLAEMRKQTSSKEAAPPGSKQQDKKESFFAKALRASLSSSQAKKQKEETKKEPS